MKTKIYIALTALLAGFVFILLGLLVVTMEQIPVSAMFLKWI